MIITVPNKDKGGVANYYQVLANYLTKNITFVKRGSYQNSPNILFKLARLKFNYINFAINIVRNDDNLILINTSLGKKSLDRDLWYILLAYLFKKRTILFIHGWNDEYEKTFFSSSHLLKTFFFKCNRYIVLSSKFKRSLESYGVNSPIDLLTTIVDDNLTPKCTGDISKKNDNLNILFLARIKRNKGVMESVQAFEILKKKYSSLNFLLAGDGTYLDKVKDLVSKNNISDLRVLGYVSGEKKREAFLFSDIYVFPSTHGEGMPTTVLESMAMGLVILTTSVGGIPDFFEEGKMGFFLESREPEYIAEKIEYLLDRPELMKEISEYNYNYAKEHFYASKVAARLEKIFDEVVQEKL